jgi:hypothetical protein
MSKINISKVISNVVIVLLAALFLYFTIYKEYDYRSCTNRIAKKLNITSDYSAILMYIEAIVVPGMDREDAHLMFQEIAPIQILKIDSRQGLLEKITIKICHHPLNNINLYAYYTFGEKLISIDFEENP